MAEPAHTATHRQDCSRSASRGARHRTGAHAFWRQQSRCLITKPVLPMQKSGADLLLAGLFAEQVRHRLHDENQDIADLAAALSAAALALAG